jgi:urease accessory protein
MNLRLLQISDSALPIGGYTHSWGLEAAIGRGQVRDIHGLEYWTTCWLQFVLGPQEGVVVAASCRAAHDKDAATLRRANEILQAGLVPGSLRQASREMGEQLLQLGATWNWSAAGIGWFADAVATRHADEAWHHAVIFGVLGSLAGATAVETVTAYLHQATLGMISAGVRGIPVSPTHGQQLLAYLHNTFSRLGDELSERDLETAGSGCPYYEVLCDAQTRLYSRMFRS